MTLQIIEFSFAFFSYKMSLALSNVCAHQLFSNELRNFESIELAFCMKGASGSANVLVFLCMLASSS
jgi:hypothetical protein